MNIIEELMGSMGPDISSQLAKSLNIDQNTAAAMIPQVAPLILGGLKRQKDNHGGAARVDHILNKYGSASVLGDLAGLFSQGAQNNAPDPRLGGLLGDSGVQASNMLANNFKMDNNTAMKIIPMLAPVILGFLSKKRDSDGAGSDGIASLLDQDGDGSILDDVAGFLLSGGGRQRGGGLLGSILGGLFGGKRR